MTDRDFSARVCENWIEPHSASRRIIDNQSLVVDVRDGLKHNSRASILVLDSGRSFVTLSPAMAESLSTELTHELDAAGIRSTFEGHGIRFNGADDIFYFSQDAENQLLAEATAEAGERQADKPKDGTVGEVEDVEIRALGPEDFASFSRFEASISESDKDEAFVELDHWEIVGAFVSRKQGPELVAVASAYPWQTSQLADIGVLTAPDHRGLGLGAAVVGDIARRILIRGYSPQYRCQGDNLASKATAASAGFTHFGTWDVIAQE